MKKAFIIIGSIVGTILLIIIAFFAYIGFSIYDGTDKTSEEAKTSELTLDDYIANLGYDALTDEIGDDKVAVALTESDLNILLYKAYGEVQNLMEEKTPWLTKYLTLRSLYCTFNSDGTITVDAPSKVLFFKTRITMKINLWYEDDGLNFTISDVGAGKLTSSSWLLKNVLKLTNPTAINDELQKNNIDAVVSQEGTTYKLYMAYDAITDLLLDNFEGSSQADIVSAAMPVVKQLLDNETLKLSFNDDSVVGASANLKDMKQTPADGYDYSAIFAAGKAECNKLLASGVIDASNISMVYDYLIRGYSAKSDSEKEEIDKIDFSTIGITDNASYNGLLNKKHVTTLEVMSDNIPANETEALEKLLNNSLDFTISEGNLSKTFNSIAQVGLSYAFTNGTDTAYVSIGAVYTEITSDYLYINIVASVNGVNIGVRITLKPTAEGTSGLKLSFSLIDISIGSIKVNEDVKNKIYSYLATTLAESDDTAYVSIDAVNETFTMDFGRFFMGDSFLVKVTELYEETSSELETGKITFHFSKK